MNILERDNIKTVQNLLSETNKRLRNLEENTTFPQKAGALVSASNGAEVELPKHVKKFTIYPLGNFTDPAMPIFEDIVITGDISVTIPANIRNTPVEFSATKPNSSIISDIVITPGSQTQVFVTYIK